MSARWLVPIVLLAVTGGMVSWWWFSLCGRDCAEADRRAQQLVQRGQLLGTLMLLDKVDARCHCARFTSGDAPPLYSLAEACIRRLQSEGRSGEIRELLAHARGPILKELASTLGDDARD